MKILPVRLAHRLGYFAAEGVPVMLEPYEERSSKAMPGERSPVQVTAGDFDTVLQQHLQGQRELLFLTLARTPQLGFGVRHPQRTGAELSLLLQNALIGLPQASRWAQRVAWMVMQAHGVQPRPAQFVILSTAQQVQTAFLLGDVDAVCVGEPLLTGLQRRGGIRVVADTRYLSESMRLLGGPVLYAGLSSPAAWVESHADELQSVARAVRRALLWLQTAGPIDLAPHADLVGFAGDPRTFLSVIMHARESFAVDGSVDEGAIHNGLRIVRLLPQGHLYDGIEPAHLYSARLATTG
ncbi:MAG: hypothetical protein P3W97_006650 [Tepidimonas sp.]|uniref:hypothetical protein n=1 Tax=Tepidimonas sp. TaxID=2002775 RepID=UPI00259DD3C9|nr:hypothetical protein [Tepidimonas sp.]MDM7456919.1 hypothetical protein [Tepidimonas sp.]